MPNNYYPPYQPRQYAQTYQQPYQQIPAPAYQVQPVGTRE